MKKYLLLLLSLALFISIGCKKEEKGAEGGNASLSAQKCAKYTASAFKDKELTAWMCTLSKAEPVELISTEIVSDNKGKVMEVARIKLSDDTEAYIKLQHLADRAIVFITDTKAYERNNTGSRVKTTIPAGKIGFVVDEKADWLQVYVGEIDGKWVTQDWVNDGFSSDTSMLSDAKLYEEAVNTLFPAKDAKPATAAQKEDAMKKLENLSSSSLFSNMAYDKLETYQNSQTTENEAE